MSLRRAVALHIALVITAAVAYAAPAAAYDPASPAPVNVDGNGVALHGYDPVAYFTAGNPTPGDASLSADYDGATYHFASADNQATFTADPAAFVPRYGGFCALAMASGVKVDIDPAAWKIVDDVLYVQANPGAASVWQRDIPGNIKRADGNWPKVKDQAPQDLF